MPFSFFPFSMVCTWRVPDKPKFLPQFLGKVAFTRFGISLSHVLCRANVCAKVRAQGPMTRHAPCNPLPAQTLRGHTQRAMWGQHDGLLSGFRAHPGCIQDRNWQEPFGRSPKSAPALSDEQSQGGRGAPKPAAAGEEHHAGRRPLPGVPEGAGGLGPGALHSVLQGPGGLGGLLLLAFLFLNRGFWFF